VKGEVVQDVHDEDLMRRFLIGEVEPDERARIEELFMRDPEYFEALCAVEEEMILSHVRGDLPERWRAPFEAHVLASPAGRRKVEDTGALLQVLAKSAQYTQMTAPWRPEETWKRSSRFRTWPRRRLLAAAGVSGMVAAAAALALVTASRRADAPAVSPPTAAAPGRLPDGVPPAATPASGTRPLMLAARLSGSGALDRSPTFRSAPTKERLPRRSGSVVAVVADEVTVDLGSVDGIARGSVLPAFRGSSTSADGEVIVTTVFRERARGQSSGGRPLQPGDRVEVGSAEYLTASAEQIAARAATGDLANANAIAAEALPIAQSADVRADVRRTALAQFGALAFRSNDLVSAGRRLREAVNAFDASPAASSLERAGILNELGVVSVAMGDVQGGEDVLRRAQALSAGDGVLEAHIANNLAAIAAMRGDRVRAEALYRSALDTLSGDAADASEDRIAVETNLTNLGASR
jgi:hypothetical protein